MIRPPSGHPLNTAVPRKMRCSLIVGGMLLSAWHVAPAAGVSAYLPLNLEPEMERQIERVLILADEPILKRPFCRRVGEAGVAAGVSKWINHCACRGDAVPRALFARLRA